MMNDQKLEEVHSFKYLGSVITRNGCSDKDIRARINQATAALIQLDTIWKSNTLSFKVKVAIIKTLIVSIFLYSSDSWTLKADTCKRIQVFEMETFRKLLRIPYTDHKTNEFVRKRVEELTGPGITLRDCETKKTKVVRACQSARLSCQNYHARVCGRYLTQR